MKTKELLIALYAARLDAERAKAAKDLLLKSEEYIDVTERKKFYDDAQTKLEQELREHVLKTGEQIHGLKIKTRTKREFSLPEAVEWCKKNFSAALTVNKKTLDDFLKTASPEAMPEFVTITESPFVTIPTDLSDIVQA